MPYFPGSHPLSSVAFPHFEKKKKNREILSSINPPLIKTKLWNSGGWNGSCTVSLRGKPWPGKGKKLLLYNLGRCEEGSGCQFSLHLPDSELFLTAVFHPTLWYELVEWDQLNTSPELWGNKSTGLVLFSDINVIVSGGDGQVDTIAPRDES